MNCCPRCQGTLVYKDFDGNRVCVMCCRSIDPLPQPITITGSGYPKEGWTQERREAVSLRIKAYWQKRRADNGAGSGDRTHKPSRAADFKSAASANSAIPSMATD